MLTQNSDRISGRVVYLVLTAASKISSAKEVAYGLEAIGFQVFIIPTPHASKALNDLIPIDSANITILEEKELSFKNKKISIIPNADLIIIAPASFNSISKIALGIADNYALTNVATALANKIPIIIAPSYDTLWNHPLNHHYLKTIASWGVNIIYPDLELDHITMAPLQKIIDIAQSKFSKIKYKSVKLKPSLELDLLLSKARKRNFDAFTEIGVKAQVDCNNSGANGCLSVRLEDWILITTSGSHISKLKKKDLTLVQFSESNNEKCIYWYGNNAPSSESPLAISLYSQFPQVNAIAHTHCNLITYSPLLSDFKTKTYIPYGEFENSNEVKKLVQNNNFAILRLHGEIAVGDTIENAYSLIHAQLTSIREKQRAK